MEVSAGVVVRDLRDNSYLCVRAFGNWDFPKGHVEQGETLVQAALRELEEETSISAGDINLLPLSAPPVVYKNGRKTAHYFAAERASEKQPFLSVNPDIGKPENDAFAWLTVSEMEILMPGRLQPVVNWIKSLQ